jgi:hypothetical protein
MIANALSAAIDENCGKAFAITQAVSGFNRKSVMELRRITQQAAENSPGITRRSAVAVQAEEPVRNFQYG